ncbi:MAG: DUF222 domain-containing protein, partial [Nitriliruptorales bacterium]
MGEAARIYEVGSVPSTDAVQPRVAREATPWYDAATGNGRPYTPVDDRVDPREALEALEHVVEMLARADLDLLDDRGLLEHTVGLDRQLTKMAAQRARRLWAVDERDAYREDACVTTASWWRWRTRRDHGEASQQVRTAERLGWLDDTRQALEVGEISPAHAEIIAAAAIPRRREAIIDHEPTLVSLARDATPREVAVACRHIAEMVDRDGTEAQPHAGPDQRRELYHSQTIDGLWDLRATLDPLTGERLHAMLNALATPDPAATPDEEHRSPAQRRHDAFDN